MSSGAARVRVRLHRSDNLSNGLNLPVSVSSLAKWGERTVPFRPECCRGVNKIIHVRGQELGLAPRSTAQVM